MSAPQLTVYTNGPIAVSGDQLNTFVQTAQTANQLRTLTGVSGMQISLQGIVAPNDGLGGDFYWNGSATAADDNLDTIVPNGSVPGAWLRLSEEGGGGGGAVTSVVGATGAVTLTQLIAGGVASSALVENETTRALNAESLLAPLTSPSFLGDPTGPTPATNDNSTSFATTAYVTAKIASATAGVSTVVGFSGAVTLTQLVTGGVAPNTYLTPLTGGVSRSLNGKLTDIVSVIDFGADPTGAADSTAAITAALASGAKNVYLPAGTYKTTATITLTTAEQKLIGAGRDATIIQINSTTATGITVSPFMQSFAIVGLSVTRVGTPVANASGINASASCSESLISDVTVQGHWVGFFLGTTDYSIMQNCFSQKNLDHGVFMQNSVAGGAMQWYLTSVLSQENGGGGFVAQATAAFGAGQLSVGTMTGCATFGNSGVGVGFTGTSTCPIQGVRVFGGFFGTDGSDELFLDTYGSQNVIRDAFFEIAGTSPTGPTLSTPASHIGNGISTTANTLDISVVGCHINQMSQNGMFLLSGANHIVGNRITNCGLAGTSGARNGIVLGTGRLVATGNLIGNTTGNTVQTCGINSTGNGSQLNITGNDFTGNNPNALIIATNGGGAIVSGNFPTNMGEVIPDAGLVVGPATGGNMGVGTINLSGTSGGIYNNGTLFSGGSVFTPTAAGIVPASGGGTTNFLRADGTWDAVGAGSGVSSFNTRTGAIVLTNADVAATVVSTPLFCGNGSGISGPGDQGVVFGTNGLNLNMNDTGLLAQFFWSTSGSEFNWSYNNSPCAQLSLSGVLALGTGLSGTIAGGNAISGIVGEYIFSSIQGGSAVSVTTGVAANITSISLPAGDWEVYGTIGTSVAASTVCSDIAGAISTTSATFAGGNFAQVQLPISTGAGAGVQTPVGNMRLNLTTTTTVFLVGLTSFATSTCKMFGYIAARRAR
jgi:Pectate lyase superfamily protein